MGKPGLHIIGSFFMKNMPIILENRVFCGIII